MVVLNTNGFEKMGFLTPPKPVIVSQPSPPTRGSSQVQSGADEVRRRAKKARGLASTILTSGSGAPLTGDIRRKTLLGG